MVNERPILEYVVKETEKKRDN
jgi:hypothetical protein